MTRQAGAAGRPKPATGRSPAGRRRLGEFTWTELADWLSREPRAAVLIPVGAFEQHGPWLPLETDAAITDRLAAGIASRVNVLLGPSLAVGASDSHLGFAGTMSVGSDGLASLLRAVCGQLLGRDRLGVHYRKPGFHRVLLMTGHAGNLSALTEAAREDGVEALPGWWELEECREVIAAQAVSEGAHADETETSLLLHYGYAVDLARIPREGFQIGEDSGPDRTDTRAISPSGILAKAIRRPSSSTGRLLHEAALRGYTRILTARGITERQGR